MKALLRFCQLQYLDIAFNFHRWYLRRLEKQELDNSSALQRQDPEFISLVKEKTARAHEQWLRGALQRVPYWRSGHRKLAELLFPRREVAVVYACSVALTKLSDKDTPWNNYALFLAAKCFLAQANAERAHQLLTEITNKAVQGVEREEVIEELAATEIALGNLEKAIKLLESIPEKALTAQAASALSFARQRSAGELPALMSFGNNSH